MLVLMLPACRAEPTTTSRHHHQLPAPCPSLAPHVPALPAASPPPLTPLTPPTGSPPWAGIDTENLTVLAPPLTQDLIGPGNIETDGDTSLEAWLIAVIVGVVLLMVPVPTYLFVRWRKRKTKQAAALAAAEAEAARQRMHSRIMRPGSKSFSLKPAQAGSADIMVQTGSIGGLAGFYNNGRLQSWTGEPDSKYGQHYNYAGTNYAGSSAGGYGISRQASATSMGDPLPVRGEKSGGGCRWAVGGSR